MALIRPFAASRKPFGVDTGTRICIEMTLRNFLLMVYAISVPADSELRGQELRAQETEVRPLSETNNLSDRPLVVSLHAASPRSTYCKIPPFLK